MWRTSAFSEARMKELIRSKGIKKRTTSGSNGMTKKMIKPTNFLICFLKSMVKMMKNTMKKHTGFTTIDKPSVIAAHRSFFSIMNLNEIKISNAAKITLCPNANAAMKKSEQPENKQHAFITLSSIPSNAPIFFNSEIIKIIAHSESKENMAKANRGGNMLSGLKRHAKNGKYLYIMPSVRD